MIVEYILVATYATVCAFPSSFARAKYDPEEPFDIIFGWTPSEIARLTERTSLHIEK